MVSSLTPTSKILFLVESPLDDRDIERHGIRFMVERGLEVSVLDVADITFPNSHNDRGNYAAYNDFDIHHVKTKAALRGFDDLARSVDLIITFVGISHITWRNLPVHKFVSRSKTSTLCQFCNPFPGWERYRDGAAIRISRIRDILSRLNTIRPIETIFSRIPLTLLGIRPITYMVIGGTLCKNYGKLAGEKTHFIKTHAMDYEIYRREAACGHPVNNIAVFIDNNLPFHRDYQLMGVHSPVQPEPYFSALHSLFERIERELGLEVVIAACPRADYAESAKWYAPRRIENMATGRLVSMSKLVISHPTTALNFAVLSRKPIIYAVTKNMYEHSVERPYIEGCARALNKPIQFFDNAHDLDLSDAFTVDNDIYDRYVKEYIKQPDSRDAPFWEIVLDAVNDSDALQLNSGERDEA